MTTTRKFKKLNAISNERSSSVLRDGRVWTPLEQIVVGDIVRLETGDTLPADGVYLHGSNLSVDESSMTGESDSKHKSVDEEPFMLSGCQILEGRCDMMVLAVGSLLETLDSETPLTTKLESLAEAIGKFDGAQGMAWSELGTIVGILARIIAIIVMAVPEGLPLAVTISLAYSMMKMVKDNNLVRHLETCETMGPLAPWPMSGVNYEDRREVNRACVVKAYPFSAKKMSTTVLRNQDDSEAPFNAGDNIMTAKNTARECGILTDGGVAIEGPQFRQLTEEQLDIIIPHLQVIARYSPTDKYTLVHRPRELGEVVAVTGDGVNDAPQLKEADGFSMGIAPGRNVYDSIRKFIQFQLTVNLVAVTMAFVGAMTDGKSPLHALFKRLPYGRFDSLITRRVWRNIVGQAIYQLCFVFSIMYGVRAMVDLFDLPACNQWTAHDVLVYNTFVFCQFFNEINCRVLSNDSIGTVWRRLLWNETFGHLSMDILCSHWSTYLGFMLRLIPIKDLQPIRKEVKRDVSVYIDIEEARPLLPSSKWRKAQNIFTEIHVVSAFRNQPRLKRTKSLFLTKDSDNTRTAGTRGRQQSSNARQ
eukprot:gene16131-19192_t